MTASVFDYRAIHERLWGNVPRDTEMIGDSHVDLPGDFPDDLPGNSSGDEDGHPLPRLDRIVFRVHFGCGEASVGRQRHVVEKIARKIHGRPVRSVEIHGYTDGRGSHGSNMRLGAERALAVKRTLTACGVDGNRMDLFSHGPRGSRSGARTDGSDDRRVEVVLIEDP
jgi:peptidoglycan-associated lipoprotein